MFALSCQWKPLRGLFKEKITPSTIVIQLVQALNSLLMKFISTFLIALFIRLRQCLMHDIFSPLITILIKMPTLIGQWRHLLSNHGDSNQQITELAQCSSISVPIGYNSNSTADFVSCKDQNSSNLRDILDFAKAESTWLAKSSTLVPSSPGKRVNKVRPSRLTSGFIPSLESIEEADEEAEDDSELVVSEEKEDKRKKNKGEGEKSGRKDDEDKRVHANELETCEREEREIAQAAWNNEGRDQTVVLTAVPIQINTVEPANVGPAWGSHRRHRIRRRLRRLWIQFITCGTNDVDEYSL
ncbi:unnamed protein product [Dibothriocephalus latus]|uniref:Uncharacterized protein n=1 Tax=Dibothriocephalus latus TaxID=60516 RepID=A0A3P7NR06_DIBLA|nr:unnamed protein product [Dibothriocephalus latus]